MPSSKTRCRSTRSFLLLCGVWNKSFCCAGVVRTSSPGVPKDRPSTDMKTCRPLPEIQLLAKLKLLWHESATPRARAALVVSHDFDGLLRLVPCRSVAPCNRSWGSPRCWLVLPGARLPCVAAGLRCSEQALAVPVAPYPAKRFPRHQLCVVSPRPIPSRRYRRFWLPVRRCCHLYTDRFHASARPQGLVPMPSPLPCPGVATWMQLDAPMGLFPQDDVSAWLRSCTRKGCGLEAGSGTAVIGSSHTGFDFDRHKVDRRLTTGGG
jgi:hypothetical protein